ncbi:MAG: hypothetical protein U5L96_11725 [Owenweeksia sp.]|nr:hypothetical protein [Owenweeksia sp.]
MKKTFFIVLFALGIGSTLTAQKIEKKWGEDSVKCHENLYIYYELARSKSYDQAYDSWYYVYKNCPASSKNNFIYGPSIVKSKLKATEDAAKEEELKKLLMDVYEQRLVYFPAKYAYVYERQALDMLRIWPDSTQKALGIFEKALELDKEHSAAFYNGYFIAAARLFNDDVFEIGDVFNAYNVVVEGIEYNTDALNKTIRQLREMQEAGTLDQNQERELARAERELARYDDVTDNINKILGPIATCDKLKLIYNQETYEANKTDTTWLRRAAKMLGKERENDEGEETDCTDNPIFYNVAEDIYRMEPSVQSARAMYILSVKNNNYSKALEFLREAAEGEVDLKKQALDYLRLASVYQRLGRLAEAKGAAEKAASLRKGWGNPYIVLATIYGSAEDQCGNDLFTKKAVYWAAIDKLKYAKSIDPSVAGKANQLIRSL